MSSDQAAPLTPKERRKARRKDAGLVDAQDKPQGEVKKAPTKTTRKK